MKSKWTRSTKKEEQEEPEEEKKKEDEIKSKANKFEIKQLILIMICFATNKSKQANKQSGNRSKKKGLKYEKKRLKIK